MADVESSPVAQGFEVLSDETRLAILRALADHLSGEPGSPAVGFADLRRRVGVRDSGNFSYHLEQLEGQFVTKTSDGYRLAPAGFEVVAAMVTGSYNGEAQLGSLELSEACPHCGDILRATYEEGILRVACGEGHEFRNVIPPAVVADRSLEGIIDCWTAKTRRDLLFAIDGHCPFCYARLELSIEPDAHVDTKEVETRCDRCGAGFEIPIIVAAARDPRVGAFYFEYGIDITARPLWDPVRYEPVDITRREDPVRFEVAIQLEGDRLVAILNESLAVVEVRR